MANKNLKTRHEEYVFSTSDLDEMAGKYLASNVVREWEEPFLDSETGEVVNVTRSEFVMKRGELLTPENVSVLNFHLQAGDIKSVLVSNIKRPGELADVGKDTIWSISVVGGGVKKKRNYILFALSLDMAMSIAKDYLEQTLDGAFSIVAAKSYTSCIVIADDNLEKVSKDADGNLIKEENVGYADFYNIQTAIKTNDNTRGYTWLVLANSVDDAKMKIRQYVDVKISEKGFDRESWDGYEIIVMSGSCASVSCVIPREFSEKYFEWTQAERLSKDPNALSKALDKAYGLSESEDED